MVAAYPRPGQGTECRPSDPEDCGVPINTALEFRFDRYLLPATAVRQSLQVFTGDERNSVFLEPDYDVVERVLVYRLPEGGRYEPGTLYTVQFAESEESGDPGFRAFDGAPLEAGVVPRQYSFLTARNLNPAPIPLERAPSCEDAMRVLARGRCATEGCHSGAEPPMGLYLATLEGLRRTAIDQVAIGTEVGARSGVTLQNPLRFGVQMPRIDPGQPANSYLLYKLFRKQQNYSECVAEQVPLLEDPNARCDTLAEQDRRCLSDPCGSCYRVELPPGQCIEPPQAELLRLREWFSRGESMPLDKLDENGGVQQQRSINKLGLRILQRWVAAGAPCP
jgi:hypothetical protein